MAKKVFISAQDLGRVCLGVVPATGTPTRQALKEFLTKADVSQPNRLVESARKYDSWTVDRKGDRRPLISQTHK